jgi:acyl carrier protein
MPPEGAQRRALAEPAADGAALAEPAADGAVLAEPAADGAALAEPAAHGTAQVCSEQQVESRDRTGPGDAGEIRRRLLAVEPGRRRRAVLLRHFTDLAAEVLGAQAAAIDPTAPLATLGFTSKRSLELRARLEESLQVRLPATVGWQFPTLEALAPYLAERMGIDLDAPAAGVPPLAGSTGAGLPPSPAGRSGFDPLAGDRASAGLAGADLAHAGRAGADPGTGDDTASLDELSDADLEALLLAKIEQLDEGQQR